MSVRFIVIGSQAKADAFCSEQDAADLCLGDADKHTYRLMGFGDFNLLKLFSDPGLRVRRAENQAAGFRQNWKATRLLDGAQLPGAAIVDAGGIVRWFHRGLHPGDLPSMQTMLDTAIAVTGPSALP